VLSALIRAARRGVDVRIIIPAESNHIVADWLSRGFYSHLLRNGIRLLLYQGAMVHAKTATIDGQWSTIGTANIDRLSLLGNYEINMEVFNTDVARQMEEIFAIDSSNTVELTLDDWQRRQAMVKFSETVLIRYARCFECLLVSSTRQDWRLGQPPAWASHPRPRGPV
jgi:cardiolipin synthase